MNKIFPQLISKVLNIKADQISNTIALLEDGATIPFISRYRKEMTGALDEVQIADIKNRYDKLCEIEKRKQTILSTIEEQGKLSSELKNRIESSWDMTELEDIYLPYKPRRRTRAEIAREKGLEPLAKWLMIQQPGDPGYKASAFIKGEVKDGEDALKGACDIIAEWISENERARNTVRGLFRREAVISSRVVKTKVEEAAKYRDYFEWSEPLYRCSSHRLLAMRRGEAAKYRDYFEWSEPLYRCSSHRLLAMRRGEAEGFLKVSISPEDELCIDRLEGQFIKNATAAAAIVSDAVRDGYKRLLKPSIETEFAASSKEKADDEAIRVFSENLKQLLLAPPLGQKRVLGIDPGFRTGCKVVCLDAQGNLLHNETIFPHPPRQDVSGSARKITHLVEVYDIQAIAIGNGTASRETENFITNLRYDRKVQVFVVSENGASVYSASKVAREEFPEYDVTVRGAVSIGRRLMDPLAELVKIDPKSIGVGQYQHDVDQSKLKKSLDQTVENCVNSVGVDINTASKHLLVYISGLGPQLAQNIIDYRKENGPFHSRKELLKVPRMGEKAFEQSAGFLRIASSENPLDNSAVHPERYALVEKMAFDLGCTVKELIADKELRKRLVLENYLSEEVGMPTLKDILEELDKPGRDPRQTIKVFEFDASVKTIDDLKEGMLLPGIVTNITNFGCFVDIGIKENGLVHISQLADRYVSDPTEIVSIHQQIMVKVMSVDKERKRVQLSMKDI